MEPQGRLGNLVTKVLSYDFTIEYRQGVLHQNADALSRMNPPHSMEGHLVCALTQLEPWHNDWDEDEWQYYLNGLGTVF